jgi:hypothetical protein
MPRVVPPVISPSTTRTPRSGEITRSVHPTGADTVASGGWLTRGRGWRFVPTAITRPPRACSR